MDRPRTSDRVKTPLASTSSSSTRAIGTPKFDSNRTSGKVTATTAPNEVATKPLAAAAAGMSKKAMEEADLLSTTSAIANIDQNTQSTENDINNYLKAIDGQAMQHKNTPSKTVGEEAVVGVSSRSLPDEAVHFEEKGLFFHIKLRVFGYGFDPQHSHGYCVDDTPSGVSHPIGEIYVDIRTVTLKQLRPIIQYNRTGGMDRRSKMFQEALFIMERLSNKFDRPKEELKKYRFGWINRGNLKAIFVRPEDEQLPIIDILSAADIGQHDLALVPLSQIEPDGYIADGN